jgi:hypothetical protein
MTRSILFAGILTCLLGAMTPVSIANSRHQARPVDVALVLAADISGSMSAQEVALQRIAYVEALQDPRVISAIQLGRHGRIAIAYMEWSRHSLQIPVMPFRVVGTVEEAQAAAAELLAYTNSDRAQKRQRGGGGTGIGSALSYAHDLLSVSGYDDVPWVIDISGDGVNNDGAAPDLYRDRLVSLGAVVNGLPIASDLSQTEADALENYYARCVIGGIGAFQLIVDDAARLAETLTYKLVMEIAGLTPPELPQARITLASSTVQELPAPPC